MPNTQRICSISYTITTIVPEVFECCVRVLHNTVHAQSIQINIIILQFYSVLISMSERAAPYAKRAQQRQTNVQTIPIRPYQFNRRLFVSLLKRWNTNNGVCVCVRATEQVNDKYRARRGSNRNNNNAQHSNNNNANNSNSNQLMRNSQSNKYAMGETNASRQQTTATATEVKLKNLPNARQTWWGFKMK